MERASINTKMIRGDRESVFKAFSDPQALEYWLAPNGMTAKIHSFEFKEGSKYEMSLFYKDNQTEGKTAGSEDRFSATFTEIKPFEKIVQTIHFQSDNPDFKDEMVMEVQLTEIDNNTTKVSIAFKNIPTGIDPKDNEDGTEQSLQKLADYIDKNKQ
jgi:uncharacterized protein YndB with AHSA1/START domain